MFPVLRQRPAKIANSPLSEINGLYINAAMWLHDDGWWLFEPGGERSEHVFRIPRHVARRRWLFSAFGIDEAASLVGARRLV